MGGRARVWDARADDSAARVSSAHTAPHRQPGSPWVAWELNEGCGGRAFTAACISRGLWSVSTASPAFLSPHLCTFLRGPCHPPASQKPEGNLPASGVISDLPFSLFLCFFGPPPGMLSPGSVLRVHSWQTGGTILADCARCTFTCSPALPLASHCVAETRVPSLRLCLENRIVRYSPLSGLKPQAEKTTL